MKGAKITIGRAQADDHREYVSIKNRPVQVAAWFRGAMVELTQSPLFVVLAGFDYYAPDTPVNLAAQVQETAVAVIASRGREAGSVVEIKQTL